MCREIEIEVRLGVRDVDSLIGDEPEPPADLRLILQQFQLRGHWAGGRLGQCHLELPVSVVWSQHPDGDREVVEVRGDRIGRVRDVQVIWKSDMRRGGIVRGSNFAWHEISFVRQTGLNGLSDLVEFGRFT
jgi:hypothetical protein